MRVLLSVGGFGPAQLTCEILANAMHFTRASGAVLHLSRGAPAYRCCDARVLLNPVQQQPQPCFLTRERTQIRTPPCWATTHSIHS